MRKKKQQSRTIFSRIIALLVIGIGLMTFGVATMAFLTLRQEQSQRTRRVMVVPAQVEYPAPEVQLADLDGIHQSLEKYRGQVVLVNLWATWCPPCVAELPTLNDFYQEYKDEGFVLIGINQGETSEVVKDFVHQQKLLFPIWLDLDSQAGRAFATMSLPSSYVIDRSGMVRLEWKGAIERVMLDQYVVPLIRSP